MVQRGRGVYQVIHRTRIILLAAQGVPTAEISRRLDIGRPISWPSGVGDLKFGDLGTRSGVWADAAVLDKAAQEFGDLEK